jgi:hypothetical protein
MQDRKEYMKQWAIEHREKRKKYMRQWNLEHKEEIKEANRNHYKDYF